MSTANIVGRPIPTPDGCNVVFHCHGGDTLEYSYGWFDGAAEILGGVSPADYSGQRVMTGSGLAKLAWNLAKLPGRRWRLPRLLKLPPLSRQPQHSENLYGDARAGPGGRLSPWGVEWPHNALKMLILDCRR